MPIQTEVKHETEVDPATGELIVRAFKGSKGEGTKQVLAERRYNLDELPESFRAHFETQGLWKKLCDDTSDDSTVYLSDPAKKLRLQDEIFERLSQGQWRKATESGGGAGTEIPAAAEAVARLKGFDLAYAVKVWKDQSKANKDAIKAKHAELIEQIKEERRQRAKASDEVEDLSDLT